MIFAFGLLAACAMASAIFVVRSKNLVHAVLWLGVTLLATAALYAMLGTSFLAGIQVLLYVGGVITLMIFGLMITRRHESAVAPAETRGSLRGAIVAGALFGVLAGAIRTTPGLDVPVRGLSVAEIGRELLSEQILAFEAVSVLLLAAMIGAIVVARRKDHVAAKVTP